jgi:hypothetical protein
MKRRYRSTIGPQEEHMKTLYSPTAAARVLNLNPARLQRWLNYDHFKTTYRALLGDVVARLLTGEDMRRLQMVIDLINSGSAGAKRFRSDEDG